MTRPLHSFGVGCRSRVSSAKDCAMTTRSTSGDGLQWAESVHTPVAPGAIETDWSGWQSWLDSYLNIERKKARDTFAEVYEALGNACIELHDEIERVEQQVAELRGAMDV